MLKDANFLFELGTEEIPAGYLPPAIEAVKKTFITSLDESRIDFNEVDVYGTPRRITVMISGLAGSQREEEVEVKGPSIKAAYDKEGNPTKALQGFMKGNGIDIKDVFTKDTGKGEYIFAKKDLESKTTGEIIPGIVSGIIKSLPFPKRMRWSDKSISFPRPISSILLLLGESVIDYEVDGIVSSNKTHGHYIQNNRVLEVKKIGDYENLLKKSSVIVDHSKRKELIKSGLESAAKKTGGKLNDDEDLLNIVTFLVEDPHIVTCGFNSKFLEIPEIVLIAEMKEHQKYFSVMDSKGKLSNNFLVVSNNPPTDFIKVGNERVISARFNDARFFYEEDRKKKLGERVDSLKNVLFHKELGSIHDKIERMRPCAKSINKKLKLGKKDSDNIDRAILICKTDLVTSMVIEFPSLQGKVGRLYAISDGEDADVAEAIEDHYKPRFHGDKLPKSMTSIVVSLSEKIDNVFGSFSVGNIPKGSQDPYALRRQANAVVELLIKNEINLNLAEVLEDVSGNYKDGSKLAGSILEFVSARAKTIFSDAGFSHDEIDACLSTGGSDFFELYKRAKSINEFRKNEKFSEMLLSFKRMNNIVSAFRKDNADYKLKFNSSLFKDDEEKKLHEFFTSRSDDIKKHLSASNYIELFELLIDGKPIIDSFFDKVLVMDEDTDLRDNRLYLLENILQNFTGMLDFSRIEDK